MNHPVNVFVEIEMWRQLRNEKLRGNKEDLKEIIAKAASLISRLEALLNDHACNANKGDV